MGRVRSRFYPAPHHRTVLAVFPHTAFRCSSPSSMRLSPARCRRHFIEPVLFVQRPVGKPRKPRCPAFDLVPFAQVRPHSRFHMKLEVHKRLAAIPIMKVANPAP